VDRKNILVRNIIASTVLWSEESVSVGMKEHLKTPCNKTWIRVRTNEGDQSVALAD